MKYAVFDWDNTVRRGYTLFSWIDYLCDRGILESQVRDKIHNLSACYHAREITHDQYADHSCKIYAKFVTGKRVEAIADVLEEYMEKDVQTIFPYALQAFRLLNEYNIAAIVISGAPKIIVERYRREFFLHEVYAFRAEARGGVYTGCVQENFGYNKMKTIQRLINYYGEMPLMGFGDSLSDMPLLQSATFPFIIFDKQKAIQQSNGIYIQNQTTEYEMEQIIRSCVEKYLRVH